MTPTISTLGIATLVAASPLVLATLGAVLTYRAGLLDIGLEGKIAVGTFTALAWAAWVPNAPERWWAPLVAIGMAVVGSVAISLVHAGVVLVGKADAFISAIGINLVGLALVPLGLQAVFGSPGSSPGTARIVLPHLHEALGSLTWIDGAGAIGALVLATWLAHHRGGAHLHAVGVAPDAAAQSGIRPARWHLIALLGSGLAAGLAASQLTVGSLGIVSPMMVAGRGFLALAAAVVARGNVWPAMLACVVMGFGEALADYLVTVTHAPQFLLALPWLLALVGLTVAAWLRVRRRA
ncbi:ABC transporter permease subunit [Stomatohabitans albus]|uniref:ABC transporter permease subunit n=1 Tax=Stomatohabitans albus TaxID=3110766 RepID=UPI00300D2B8D